MSKGLLHKLKRRFAYGSSSAAPRKHVEPVPIPKPDDRQEHLFDFNFIGSALKRPPICQAMMVDGHKLIYLPIAKNACSSLKRTVAMLGGLTLAKGEDIHHKLDSERTGLQFEDRPDHEIRLALSDPDWMRFLVIRHPMDRLISVYVEKFVLHRMDATQAQTIGPVFQAVLGKEIITHEDYDRGLTFREFAQYITSEPPERLNGHWRPQSEYLGRIPFTHVYDVTRLQYLEADLQAHVGQDIALPRLNVSRDTNTDTVFNEWAADARPSELHNPKKLSVESFLPEDLHRQLSEYYATDLTLHRLIEQADKARGF